MANKIRSIMQVVNSAGFYGVMVIERDAGSEKIHVIVTQVDPETGRVDIEEGDITYTDEDETRSHPSVWDYNTTEAEVSING